MGKKIVGEEKKNSGNYFWNKELGRKKTFEKKNVGKKTKKIFGQKKKFWIKKMVRKKISRKKWAGKKIIVGEKKNQEFFLSIWFQTWKSLDEKKKY